MTDSAAFLADELLPAKPIRKWVLSLPFALRFLLATDAGALTRVLGIVYRTISAHILKKARRAPTSCARPRCSCYCLHLYGSTFICGYHTQNLRSVTGSVKVAGSVTVSV